jgi:hypothetical protein
VSTPRRLLRIAVISACALAACSHGSSGAGSGASATPGVAAAGGTAIPPYPGARALPGQSSANGVSVTDDSFQTVYAWYKAHLPAGSEQQVPSFMKRPAALFEVGNSEVTISVRTDGQTQMAIVNASP